MATAIVLACCACGGHPRARPVADEVRAAVPESSREETLAIATEFAEEPNRAVLTIPATGGPHPAVLLVHGGGCTNVDCAVGPDAFPWARELAFALAERGVAMLRYHRAPSPGVPTDIELGVQAWIRLTNHPAIRRPMILLGHSEGSWQSALVAEQLLARENVPDPDLLVQAGVLTLDIADAVSAQLTAVAEPLATRAERGALLPAEVADYLRAWRIPEAEIIGEGGVVDAELVRAHARTITESIRPLLASDPRLASWSGIASNVDTSLGLRGALSVLIVSGSRDQETPPAQAQSLHSALSTETDETAVLFELDRLNHYFAELPDDEPLAAAFGPISPRFVDIVARAAWSGR